jgi:exopolyphosphatase/guanosine-5'-triphosphate,3'-diphosphate pyrophosphatase
MTARARVGAAADVGSNSVHLLVATVGRATLRPLLDESVQLGLGAVVDGHGRLPGDARLATVEVLAGYVARARALGAEAVTLLGTEPLRRASDRSVLQAEVLEATGMPLHVLSHDAEAELTLLGVTNGRAPSEPLLVIDIGGGSTELILAGPDADPVVGAIPAGSERLARRHVQHDPPAASELDALRDEAEELMAAMPAGEPARAIVVGGEPPCIAAGADRASGAPAPGGDPPRRRGAPALWPRPRLAIGCRPARGSDPRGRAWRTGVAVGAALVRAGLTLARRPFG